MPGIRLFSVVVGALTIGALAIWGVTLLLAVWVPYHRWDELAFGEWSRLVAVTGGFRFDPAITPLVYQRPLFYVGQGWIWRWLGDWEGWGRLWAIGFWVLLVVSTARLSRVAIPDSRVAYRGAVAILVLLGVQDVALSAGAGLTEVPVAALVAATAATLWTMPAGSSTWVALTLLSALAMLAKPSALPALVGLGVAHVLGPWQDLRARLSWGVAPIVLGALVGLLYAACMAAELGVSVRDFLQGAILDGYYVDLAQRARVPTLVGATWFGPYSRLLLVVGLGFALARTLRADYRSAALGGITLGVAWGWLGPWWLGASSSPWAGVFGPDAYVLRIALSLSPALCLLPWAEVAIRPPRLVCARVLVWIAPAVVSWALFATYETRLLSPAWPGLVLLASAVVTAGIETARRELGLVAWLPVAILAHVAAGQAELVDGQMRLGWERMWTEFRSGRTSAPELRRVVMPELATVLDVLERQPTQPRRIFSPDGQLRYFHPGRVVQAYPTGCAALEGSDYYVLPLSDAVRAYFESQVHVSADPEFWDACREPSLTRIFSSEAYVIYAISP